MKEFAKDDSEPMTYLHLIRDMCAAAGYRTPVDHLDQNPGSAYLVDGYKARQDALRAGIARPPRVREFDAFAADNNFVVFVPPNQAPPPEERNEVEMEDTKAEAARMQPQPAAGSMDEVLAMLRAMQVQQQAMQRGQDESFGAVNRRLDTMTGEIQSMRREQQWIRSTVTQFGQTMQGQFPDLAGFQFPPWNGGNDGQ